MSDEVKSEGKVVQTFTISFDASRAKSSGNKKQEPKRNLQPDAPIVSEHADSESAKINGRHRG